MTSVCLKNGCKNEIPKGNLYQNKKELSKCCRRYLKKKRGDILLKKERLIPIIILVLEALLRRLPQNHLKRDSILDEWSRRYAGYRGEQNVDRFMRNLQLPSNYFLFHDLRIPLYKDLIFQIDTLLLTRITSSTSRINPK